MKILSIAAIFSVSLAACGGGGGGTTSQPVSSSAPTTPLAGTVSTPGAKDQVVEAPTPPASAVKMTAGSFTQGGSAQNAIVNFTGAANLTLSGRLDGIWLSAAKPGGSVVVSGDLNTVVFMAGVDTTVTVTGSGNTFYLPLGSPIKLEGSGLVSSTIRYYKS